jgi:hypothetical protein
MFAFAATNQAMPININDPHVFDVANFAITEYNKKTTATKLKLEKVINALSYIVNGETKYILTVSANYNGSTSNKYEAFVSKKPSEHLLTFFALFPLHY